MIDKLKNYITKVNMGGAIDSFIFNLDSKGYVETRTADSFNLLGVFVRTKNNFFETKKSFGIKDITELLRLMNLFKYDKFINDEEYVLFSRKRNKLKWGKIDILSARQTGKTKEDLLKHYSKSKVSISLTSKIIDSMKNTLSVNFSNKIRFISKKGKLRLICSEDSMNKIEVILLNDCKNDKIDLLFDKGLFLKILQNIPINSKLNIDFVKESIPLHFEDVSKDGIEADYFLSPLNS